MIKLVRNMEKREALMILSACVLILLQINFDLKIPDFINQMTVIINSVGSDINSTWEIGFQMLGCLIASTILSIISGYLIARAASGFTYTLRKNLFDKVMSFSDEEISKFSIPSLITRSTNDITQIQTLISMGLQIIVKAPVTAVWAICKIAGKNWQLTALTAAFIAVVCVGVLTVMIMVFPKFKKIQKLTDKINLVVRENITGINVVQAFNAQNYQNAKFENINKDMTFTQLFNQRAFSVLQPIIEIATTGLWFSIYWLGAALLIPMQVAQRVSFFGEIVAFAMYANYILISFMMMVFIFMMIPPAVASGERIIEVLNTNPKIFEGNNEIVNKDKKILEFKDVYFKYPNTRTDMLKKINFDLSKGETLAIIGPTGSGKTTLVNLITRFYDATAGKINIKGVDIKKYTFKDLYKTVFMATQKPVIFYGTIKDNIKFGMKNDEITEEEIDQSIAISQSKDFVDQLENKIDTAISQGGKNVSGGQKQRISIARAIARKPEILILDDTFSALDYKTDSNLRKDLNNYLKDTTKIIVAQRIGTIKNADKILVLENGEIVGLGKHEQLLKTCQTYQEIAISQMKAEELSKINHNE